MKICVRCEKSKTLEEFPPNGGGRRSSRCRPCKREYDNEYYKTNNSKMRSQRKVSRPLAKSKIQQAVWDYLLQHPCPCGESDPVALEFDHRNPEEKLFTIGNSLSGRRSLENIMKEIAKCDVLCANCHRRRTARQFGWYRLIKI